MVFERKEPEKEKKADKHNKPALWCAQTGICAGDNVNDGLFTILEASTGIGDNVNDGLLTILEASTEIGDSLVGAR